MTTMPNEGDAYARPPLSWQSSVRRRYIAIAPAWPGRIPNHAQEYCSHEITLPVVNQRTGPIATQGEAPHNTSIRPSGICIILGVESKLEPRAFRRRDSGSGTTRARREGVLCQQCTNLGVKTKEAPVGGCKTADEARKREAMIWALWDRL